ncbi:MAG: hypothetical protein HY396_00995 [Candidatus Doudnabacteria bacterium]|nr:hypothetical protein [Candidatus Doudnabacteria bacterium]
MLDFTKLWNKTYLFGPNPIELVRSDFIFFWTSLALVAAGIILKIFAIKNSLDSPKRYLFNRLFHLCFTMGLLILLWFGFRFENIPWLSTHFVVLSLLLIWLVWLVFIGKYFFSQYRAQQKIWQDEAIKRKYLNTK